MRGTIDVVREITDVRNGATTRTYVLIGRDHGKIFEITPIWFDTFSSLDGVMSLAYHRMQSFFDSFAQQPAQVVVEMMLMSFLQEILVGSSQSQGRSPANLQRATGGSPVWNLPVDLPVFGRGAAPSGTVSFADALFFLKRYFDPAGRPQRGAIVRPEVQFPGNTSVWQAGQYFADLNLSELYVDLVAGSTIGDQVDDGPTAWHQTTDVDYLPTGQSKGFTPDNTLMGVVFRDRPYPTSIYGKSAGSNFVQKVSAVLGSPWFTSLPTHTVLPEEIRSSQIDRSGSLRRNAFYAGAKFFPETQSLPMLQHPLWIPESIKRHGMRTAYVSTLYTSINIEQNDLLFTSTEYRNKFAEFHAFDHLFWNGTVHLTHGRPDIRIGSRVVVPGIGRHKQRQFYVEGVVQDWNYNAGLRTQLCVTRGFFGKDEELAALVESFTNTAKDFSGHVPTVSEPTYRRAAEPNRSPTGGKNLRSAQHFPRGSEKLEKLILLALKTIDESKLEERKDWADFSKEEGFALHSLIHGESRGYVGRPGPGFKGWENSDDWPVVWKALQDGNYREIQTKVDYTGDHSSACGLGQFIIKNAELFIPKINGKIGYGDPVSEMIGVINYIIKAIGPCGHRINGNKAPYGKPSVAFAFWSKKTWVDDPDKPGEQKQIHCY